MASYSKELKDSIITRLITGETGASDLARETGISINTIYRWRDRAKKTGISSTTKFKSADKWSTQDKFQIVLETALLNEIELAEYCRKKGLYPQQVKGWKDACIQANGGVAEEASRLNLELKKSEQEKKNLERELRRKEKALAETAALLVLRKNAYAIWGEQEEE
ncbi:MAG: transposase [Mobilitalea sp.]